MRCPGTLILKTYDLARALRDEGRTVIGGFHTPMEKECLDLLRGAQPVIVCPARSIDGFRLPAVWKKPLGEGRLLLLSPFKDERRVTAELARRRNAFAAAVADEVFIAYAEPGGRTEGFAREVVGRGKRVWTFESEYNQGLIGIGARAIVGDDGEWGWG